MRVITASGGLSRRSPATPFGRRGLGDGTCGATTGAPRTERNTRRINKQEEAHGRWQRHPVLEEELVVSRRLILREEIHLIKRHTEEVVEEGIPVDHDEVEIQRLDAEGQLPQDRTFPFSAQRGGEDGGDPLAAGDVQGLA